MDSSSSKQKGNSGSNYESVAANSKEFASIAQQQTLAQQIQRFLHNRPTAAPFLVLLLAVLVFSTLVGDRFFHPFNLSLVLQQVTIIGVLGIAQTLIILTAGIDLSVGAIMVLTSVVMGRMAIDYGLGAPAALAIGLGVGALAGAINGWLVSKIKLPPFIATLVRGISFSPSIFGIQTARLFVLRLSLSMLLCSSGWAVPLMYLVHESPTAPYL